jgi:hypothetical protein
MDFILWLYKRCPLQLVPSAWIALSSTKRCLPYLNIPRNHGHSLSVHFENFVVGLEPMILLIYFLISLYAWACVTSPNHPYFRLGFTSIRKDAMANQFL